MTMIRICFLIRQWNQGGAQRQLLNLLREMDKTKYDISVLSFYGGGIYEEEIKQLPNVKYHNLRKRNRWDVFIFLFNLIRRLRQIDPGFLHGYLNGPNCLAVLLKPFIPKTLIIWGVRASNMDYSRYDWLARFTYNLERFLSRFADQIIVNSKAGYEHAALNGFPKKSMTVIPNGIDIEQFRPSKEIGLKLREQWGANDNEILIGLIGRIDPMKDHSTFLKAAEIVKKETNNIRFVCVGEGPESYKQELIALGRRLGLSDRLVWAGSLKDMPTVYNALDMVCSSSFGEGFPNVIGEAMACGIPCVVTDVGDSAWIVGDTGVVVPPKNPKALAEGLLRCLNNEEASLQARLRIEKNFSLKKMVERTESVLFTKKLLKS
jgi:glycosyltransferase involved in cell wall biosynthesis